MNRRLLFITAGGLLAVVLLAPLALAATGFDLSWCSVDGGGGMSAGGNYALQGAIGQPDAGTLAGGGYALAGGFWSGAVAAPTATPTPTGTLVPTATFTPTPTGTPTPTATPTHAIYLPLVMR